MHVGGSQAEFAGAGLEYDSFWGVDVLELLGYFEGAVGGAVVHYDHFPVEVAGGSAWSVNRKNGAVLRKERWKSGVNGGQRTYL